MTVLVHAEIHGITGTAAELAELLGEHAAATARDEGAIGCTVYRALGADAGEFVLDAWWRDERTLRAHYSGASYATYAEQAAPLLARPSDVEIHYVERSVRAVADLSSDPTRQG